ncbi:hypothetical protein [Comamonas serinivorans]|nr:hypothetical protein [Comamonas serinivorans]
MLHEGSRQERLAGVFETAREAAMAAAQVIEWRRDAIGFSAALTR